MPEAVLEVSVAVCAFAVPRVKVAASKKYRRDFSLVIRQLEGSSITKLHFAITPGTGSQYVFTAPKY